MHAAARRHASVWYRAVLQEGRLSWQVPCGVRALGTGTDGWRQLARSAQCPAHGATGPGKAWTALEQGEYLFELAERKPFFIRVPVALMDGIIGFLDLLAKVFPGLEARCPPSLCVVPPCTRLHHCSRTGGSPVCCEHVASWEVPLKTAYLQLPGCIGTVHGQSDSIGMCNRTSG